MEDNLRMGTNSKKSGAKKKNSSGKSSKSGPPIKPESEEAAPLRLDSTLPSKKRKSDEKQIPLPEKNSGAGKSDQGAAKGKKSMSGSLKSEAWERQLRPRKVPKTFQDVSVGEADATRVIGRRLRVFWPLDDKWYSGLVKSFDVKKKRHHVVYDDGDEEWLELKKERVKMLFAPGELFGDKLPKENQCADGTTDMKQKESSSSSSGDVKKSGAKRKRHSVVEINKKNDGRRKKEAHVKEEKQESTQNNKHEEETQDGETMEENAAANKVVVSEQLGSVDAHSEMNEAHQKEDTIENENEIEGKNSNKEKSSRRTAPRSKRGASARRSQAKPVTEHNIEDINVKQHGVGHSEAKPDVNLEEGSRAAVNTNLEDISVPEIDSILNDDDDEEKQQKETESEKKADSSVAETDIVGDMDAKGVSKLAENLDGSATVAAQLGEQQKDDLVKQGNEDEPIRRTADQSSEKHLDVTVVDEKATEKQVDVKDADQLNKKHSKKHRGKVKPRQ